MQTIFIGAKGEHVKRLQSRLNQVAGANLKEDGHFGPVTETAVKTFQAKAGLKPDGVVGLDTAKALGLTALVWETLKLNGNPLNVMDVPLPTSQYIATPSSKTQIVLHHTAGNSSAVGVVRWWETDPSLVATAFVIAGPDKKPGDKQDGQIVRCFPDECTAHHIGPTTRDPRPLHAASIGIEICSWGVLHKTSEGFINYVHQRVPDDQVCTLKQPFRGSLYYHKYTAAQIESLRQLLLALGAKHNIPLQRNWRRLENFETMVEALDGKPGLWSHTNYRTDKSDVFPQPELIEMLTSL